jgi:uncharacterized membrane protein
MTHIRLFIQKHALLLILGITTLLGGGLAYTQSPTTDEAIHVASGYLAITEGEYRFDPEHPFLFKYLSALPVLIIQPNLPPDHAELWEQALPTSRDSWMQSREWADQWLYLSGNDPQQMIFLSRIPAVLCLVLLVWLTYWLTSLWFGRQHALLAALFTAFNPNLLAHGSLANTDVPMALAFLGLLWALWGYAVNPTIRNAFLVGILLGLGLTTKYTALICLPIAGTWMFGIAWKSHFRLKGLIHFLLAMIVSLAVIWLVYTMPWRILHGTAFTIYGELKLPPGFPVSESWLEWYAQLRYFAPVDYLKGLALVVGGSAYGRPTFLLGHTYSTGIWWYFPVLFILKTQIIALFVLLSGSLSVLYRLRKTAKKSSYPHWLILIAGGIFLAAALKSKLNIGIRHIAPLFPLISIALAGATLQIRERLWSKDTWVVPCVLLLYVLPVLAQYPNLLGYSNTFIHDKGEAYRYFGDSNLEWGNHSKEIADYLNETYPDQPVYMNYKWSPYAIAAYGRQTLPFDPKQVPENAFIVLTATQVSSGEYSLFHHLSPVATLGNHTFVYRTESVNDNQESDDLGSDEVVD